jgi:plasmid stability protein
MGDLLIRDISNAMKRGIADRAERNGRSLSEEAKRLIERGMTADAGAAGGDSPSAWDSLRDILAPLDADEAAQFAKIMDDIEAERKTDFGRPIEGFE